MRVLHATGAMLLPLVVLSGLSLLSSRSLVAKLESVVTMALDELEPVSALQNLMFRAAMPANDYLIHGHDAEKELHARLSSEVDRAFVACLTSPSFREVEDPLRRARDEWERARAVGDEIVALPDPVGDPRGASTMEVFDGHIDRASEILDAVREDIHRRGQAARSQALVVQQRHTTIVAAVCLAALALAATGAGLLARSVTSPLKKLKEGILRFTEGDHSFRVILDRKDELGQLADVMNAMADRLEHDSLTGVYSRRAFERMLGAEVARCLRYGRVFSLLVLDVDRFKSVNDAHGHPAGDEALRAIATIASEALRRSDVLARVGGEEFAILLPETPGEGGVALAERVRAQIAERSIELAAGKTLKLTVSIGVAAYAEDASRADELFALADQALYRAKQAGRNRVLRCVRVEPLDSCAL